MRRALLVAVYAATEGIQSKMTNAFALLPSSTQPERDLILTSGNTLAANGLLFVGTISDSPPEYLLAMTASGMRVAEDAIANPHKRAADLPFIGDFKSNGE